MSADSPNFTASKLMRLATCTRRLPIANAASTKPARLSCINLHTLIVQRSEADGNTQMPVGYPKGCRRQPIPCPWHALHPGLNTCMQTFQASVRVRVDGRSQIVQTQIRAPNSIDARWLLWAQFGFHSITSGPSQVKNESKS